MNGLLCLIPESFHFQLLHSLDDRGLVFSSIDFLRKVHRIDKSLVEKRMECCSQFFETVMNALQRELLEISFLFDHKGLTEATEMFQGELKSIIQCSKCGEVSEDSSSFFSLHLPVPACKTENSVSCYDCLESFTETEHLDEFRCKTCSKDCATNASKKTEINFPKLLVFTFNRFVWDRINMTG